MDTIQTVFAGELISIVRNTIESKKCMRMQKVPVILTIFKNSNYLNRISLHWVTY